MAAQRRAGKPPTHCDPALPRGDGALRCGARRELPPLRPSRHAALRPGPAARPPWEPPTRLRGRLKDRRGTAPRNSKARTRRGGVPRGSAGGRGLRGEGGVTTPGRRALLISVRNSERGERSRPQPREGGPASGAWRRHPTQRFQGLALAGCGVPANLCRPPPRLSLGGVPASWGIRVLEGTSWPVSPPRWSPSPRPPPFLMAEGLCPLPVASSPSCRCWPPPRNHTQPLGASLHPSSSSWAPPVRRRPCLRAVTSSPLHTPNLKNKTSCLRLSRPRPHRGCWRPSSDRLGLDSTQGVTRSPPPGAQLPAQAPWPGTRRGKRSHGSHPSPPPHLPLVRPS